MDWIKWDQTLELGHEEMDTQHRQLVALVDQLADSIVEERGKEAYGALLDDLFAHTKVHFATEERLMAEYFYPNAERHRLEHATLINDALGFRAKFDASGEPSVSLIYFFDQWLSRHILSSDRELANFIAGKG